MPANSNQILLVLVIVESDKTFKVRSHNYDHNYKDYDYYIIVHIITWKCFVYYKHEWSYFAFHFECSLNQDPFWLVNVFMFQLEEICSESNSNDIVPLSRYYYSCCVDIPILEY